MRQALALETCASIVVSTPFSADANESDGGPARGLALWSDSLHGELLPSVYRSSRQNSGLRALWRCPRRCLGSTPRRSPQTERRESKTRRIGAPLAGHL